MSRGPVAGDADRLDASEAAAAIAAGSLRSEALVADCLARIAARDAQIGAWAFVDAERALDAARCCDASPPRGLLHGLPVGVKDVLDTFDLPTLHGSPLYAGARPAHDSDCVAALRRAGAIVLGKTTTTEFASPIGVGVRHPGDPTRTPGVSSSGSAAAVADRMVPLAIGTQTGGSVIRPASYCGVFGYKASIDGLPRGGIRHLRPSLDSIGLFARALPDIALLQSAMLGRSHIPATAWPQSRAPRLGFCRTGEWPLASPETQRGLDLAVQRLAAQGATVQEIELPPPFDQAIDAFSVIVTRETAATMKDELARHLDALNPWLRGVAAKAAPISDGRYADALAVAVECRALLAVVFGSVDAIVAPAASGEAPQDRFGMADPAFAPLWTLMHGPAISVPAFEGPHGMPIGLQLVGPVDGDDRTLGVAGWVVAALAG
jgi:Asp-tRNA(Asn)/Glu-tRNA(Gln) amidotransferase A subunit family amidase